MSIIVANIPLVVPVPAGFRLQFGTPISGSCVVTLPDRILTETLTDGEGLGPYQSDASVSITSTVPGTCWTIRQDGPTVTLQAAHLAQAPYMPGVSVFIGESASGPATLAGWSGTQFQALVSGAGNKVLLPKLAAGISAMKAGTRNAKILCLGDSTTAGLWASGAGYTNNRPLNYPNALAAALASRYATYVGNSFGSGESGGIKANFLAYDTRWNLDANWTPNSGFLVNGGAVISSGVNGAVATFTPAGIWDKADIYFVSTATTGTVNWRIGSGPVTQINTANATNQIIKVTVSGAAAAQALTLTIVGTSSVFVCGISTYLSTTKGIEVITAGGGGYTSATLAAATNAWDPAYVSGALGASMVIKPDLTAIMVGINDWSTAVAPATFATNLQNIINAWKLAGDVALVTPVPQSSGTNSLAVQLGIIQEVRKAAVNNGLLLIEGSASFGDWAYASGTLGYYAPANDVTHPGATGYTALGNLVANAIGL